MSKPLHNRTAAEHVASILALPFVALLFVYKYTISPALHLMVPGGGCRFTPTCSEYAIESLKAHGLFRGGWLAIRRLAKCHPWGPCGHDPVPSREDSSPENTDTPCGHDHGSHKGTTLASRLWS